MVGMRGATTKRTRKEAEARAAAAARVDYIRIPSEEEFRDALVIICVLKKLGHPEGYDFAAARIIPKSIETRPRSLFSDPRGALAIPHLPLATSDAPDERELKYKEMRDSLSESRFDLRRLTPGTWGPGSMAYDMAMANGMPNAAEMRAIATECFPQLRDHFPQYFDDTSTLDYITGEAPPSETAEPSAASGMRDDLNTKVKKAKAENLARGNARPSTHQLATYKALVQNVDLLNPDLAEDERLRRAKRLVKAYGRVRERRPQFHDKHKQLRVAFSIVNSHQYERTAKPKREAAKKLAMG
jgi:hypothetical protein